MRSNICLAKSEEDLGKAAKEAALSCAFDALPVTEVSFAVMLCPFRCLILLPAFQAVSVVHSVLRRCVDGGWLSMVGCLIQALHVPIIPPDDLCDFYKNPNVSYLRDFGERARASHGG